MTTFDAPAADNGVRIDALQQRVRTGPLDRELSFPYHPHVTVAHHLDDEVMDRAFTELADFDCAFEVVGFHLYVHDEDEGWRPTREFRLTR